MVEALRAPNPSRGGRPRVGQGSHRRAEVTKRRATATASEPTVGASRSGPSASAAARPRLPVPPLPCHARIVLLPGDGIGPEVTAAARLVLDAAARAFSLDLAFESHDMGGAALRTGRAACRDETLAACRSARAVLLGAVGDPAFDHLPSAERPEGGLLALRRGLGVYANLRPTRIWPGCADAGPLKRRVAEGADLLIVRELTGGLYFGEPRRSTRRRRGVQHDALLRGEIERIARVAFEAARRRRRHVTSVDKANVLETSQLWRRVVTRVAQDYPTSRSRTCTWTPARWRSSRRPLAST
jgi:isocitrate/isopropylmalate dehydrogenase